MDVQVETILFGPEEGFDPFGNGPVFGGKFLLQIGAARQTGKVRDSLRIGRHVAVLGQAEADT